MGLAADIYADQLSYLKHGHPQWRPEPMEREPPMIGDLGHLLDGQFRRLFCCARPPKHELSEMSPRNFYQLQYDKNLLVNRERAIDPGTVQGKNVTVSKFDIYRARPLTSVDFSCSSEQGALLAMPYHASSRAVRPNREFIDYFKKNHELWFDDVINNWGLDVKPEDLILVRGYVKTTEFSLAAVCQKKYSYWFFPDLQIDTFRALAGMKFHPNSSQVVQYRTGPNRVSPYPYVKFTEDDPDHGADPSNPSKSEAPVVSKTSPASGVVVEVVSDAVPGDVLFREGEEDRDDGEGEDEDGDDGSDATLDRPLYADEEDAPINMVRDQTIFLKYYKLRRRLFFPEKIVAHGEPKDPPLPPDHNPNAPPLIPRSDSWEPLDQLLIYLLRHSSADIAIACDDDVYLTCEGHEWPNNFENFYEVTRPRIFVDDDNGGFLKLNAKMFVLIFALQLQLSIEKNIYPNGRRMVYLLQWGLQVCGD
ncbi:hypothetical protein ABKN59_009891 [Abortiporus biennis]